MSEEKAQVSRRDFLKITGLVGVAAQAAGFVAGGVAAGADPQSHTGWESSNSGTQSFNRKPFEVAYPPHKPVGEVRRPSHLTDYVFGRVATFQTAYEAHPGWQLTDPIGELELPPPVEAFYKLYPERLEWDYKTFSETIPTNREDQKKYGAYYTLANAYSNGFSAVPLPRPTSPPEESDFQIMGGSGPRPLPAKMPFKSKELAAEWVKEIAHKFGATLVGITRAKLDWMYSEGWYGCPPDYDYSKLPKHWKYAVVIGVPMEWDVVLGSPNISTSYEAYNRVSTTALRIDRALKELGYATRVNAPSTSYDCLVPPYAVDAGLGEVCRPGFMLAPETGSNLRTAVLLTELEMATDAPIKFGVEEFCNKCKICAEQCPSGAISGADSPAEQDWGSGSVLRGYEHWYINNGACYNFWRESMGPMGCRLCVANCPYSRKDNWMHEMTRELDPRDPTGLVSSGLLWMQKSFFPHPTAEEYHRPPRGSFAQYRDEPTFLKTERYLNIVTIDPKGG